MSKKLTIKYLVHGSIEVRRPQKWDKWSRADRRLFVDGILDESSDKELIDGFRDSGIGDQIFDESPDASAVIDPNDDSCEYTMLSPVWHGYAYGTLPDNIYLNEANELIDCDDLIVRRENDIEGI